MLLIPAITVSGALQPSERIPEGALSIAFDGSVYSVITYEDLIAPAVDIGADTQFFMYVGSATIEAASFGLHFNRSANFSRAQEMPHGSARCHDSGCRWDQIEPNADGVYNWAALDAWTQGNAGKFQLYTLIGVPPGYSSDTTGVQNSPFSFSGAYIPRLCSPPTSAGLTALTAFITALCTRYPQINCIEVWNESNSDSANYQWWWGTAQQLADLIKTVSVAAKAVNPQIKIAATACVGFEVTGSAKSYSTTVLNTVAAGDATAVHNRVDVITGHLYTSTLPPFLAKQTTAELKAVLAGIGATKPVYDTESGLLQLEKEKGPGAITDEEYVRKYFAHHLLCFGAGLEKVFWYTVDHEHMGYINRANVVKEINGLIAELAGHTLDVYYFGGTVVAYDPESGESWTY